MLALVSSPSPNVDEAVADKIYHFRSPHAPQFRFEWHPQKKKVYLIRVGTTPEIGEVFAHEIENHGAAWNAVLILMRGYRLRDHEKQLERIK